MISAGGAVGKGTQFYLQAGAFSSFERQAQPWKRDAMIRGLIRLLMLAILTFVMTGSSAAIALPKTNQCGQSPVRLHLLWYPPTVLAKQSTSFASGDLTDE
jgi:hypothetical protein